MDARSLGRAVAVGRIGFGLGLILAPERVTGPWLGRDARRAGTRVAARGLGARDVGLGAGALAAGEDALAVWLAAAVAGDLADLTATLAAGDSLPLSGRLLVGALAAGGAGLGAVALAGLRGGSA
jgi:hypothetical protein